MLLKIWFGIFLVIELAQSINSQSWMRNTYSFNYLDINKIKIPINNIGGLNRGSGTANWQYGSKNYGIVYDHGPWIVGKINGFIHLAFEQWNGSYSPGPIINDDAAMNVHPEDSTKYRVYKIGLVDTLNGSKDYNEWPSEYGAEVGTSDFPVIYGHQTVWTIYNSVDSSIAYRKIWNNFTDTLPIMPIEIHQLAYASEWGLQPWLEDVVFFEWTIINKGLYTIDSAYFGLWTDIDFHDATLNIPAVDSAIQLGYCWDTLNTDPYFIPMAVGHLFKYGPVISSQGDSAIYKGEKKENFKNIRLTSFHGIGDDSYPPHHFMGTVGSLGDAWNFAQGLDGYGNNIIDPTTGFPTKFPFSGDPVTGYGYLFPPHSTSGGAGYILFSGPFNFAPQDTQWVMAALIVSTGEDYKDAISKLRQKANILQNTPYDVLVKTYSASPPPVIPPERFSLSQNFPNPFNNETKIIFDIPYRSRVIIKVYDILGSEVAQLLDEIIEGNHYEISFKGNSLASGVYFYQIFAEGEQPGYFLQTKKMMLLK
jgi:hypothetical protein